jgi:DNA-3-methyladenine glycosylase
MSRPRRAATLPVGLFRQDAPTVAQALLGQILVTEFNGCRTAGRIVEVEAYLGAEDPASHAYRHRRHAQNQSLYLPAGTWYVYLSYGMHWCANLVVGEPGEGGAVLLRALQPVEGLAAMSRRRGVKREDQLCAGPGRLCEALGITRNRLDGQPMHRSLAWVVRQPPTPPDQIVATPRIGISRANDWPLRFLLGGSPWASGPRSRP